MRACVEAVRRFEDGSDELVEDGRMIRSDVDVVVLLFSSGDAVGAATYVFKYYKNKSIKQL